MKKKLTLGIVILALMMTSFLAGGYVRQLKDRDGRMRLCYKYISFALDRAEYADISDRATMTVLISDLYAAHEFCDDSEAAAQIHDLWDELIHDSTYYAQNEELLIRRLNIIWEQLEAGE